MSSHISKLRTYLSPPDLSGGELSSISQVIESNWIAPLGPAVDKFEQELSERCQRNHVVALSSGTAAIHLALAALGIGHGDHVLVQSFTFVATANPVLYLGAVPIFIGSESDSWNMSPYFLEQAIKQHLNKGIKPKAVIAVDLYGTPADYKKIREICLNFEIPLIQDSAESLGSSYDGKPAGSHGDISVLSFNGNKIITTSGGGALLTDNQDWANTVRHLATQARDPAPHYQHTKLGYNYRMSNVLAALGSAQLSDLDRRVVARRSHFEDYRNRLSALGCSFPIEPTLSHCNRWLTSFVLPSYRTDISPEDVRLYLEQSNIESRPLWKPLHRQPLFDGAEYFGDETEVKLFVRGLCVPSGSQLTPEDRGKVISEITNKLRK